MTEIRGPSTIVALLRAAAKSRAGVATLPFGAPPDRKTYSELFDGALRCGGGLAAAGVGPGDCVIVTMTNTVAAIEAYFGALAIGAVPAPIAPPSVMATGEAYRAFVQSISHVVGTRRLIADGTSSQVLEGYELEVLTFEEVRSGPPVSVRLGRADELAYVQCTSGSTSAPKPVPLRHAQVLANVHSITHILRYSEDDMAASWVPLFHDMGLVGTLLCSMAAKIDLILAAPESFILDPYGWWRRVSEAGMTLTCGPCFSYAFSARRVPPERAATLDLSRLRMALIGSDPIDARALEAFAERFGPAGFDPRSFVPAYGLAEACVAVSLTPPGRGWHGEPRPDWGCSPGVGAQGARLVACGEPVLDTEIEIRDEEGRPLDDRAIGEIHVRGPAVMSGYFGVSEATERGIVDGWLRTGDLGYLSEGELYVIGRLKDMLIIRGRNYYAEDIERAVDSVSGVRVGGTVAFGGSTAPAGPEHLYVVTETAARDDEERAALRQAIATRILERIGIRPHHIELVAPRTLPKTTSGKKQRARVRDEFLGKARDMPGARR